MSFIDNLSRPRTLATLLAVSLAANVFLAGAIAGRISAQRLHGAPVAVGTDTLIQFVPEEGRNAMRAHLKEHRPELRAEHKELRRLHERIGEELQHEQPDRTVLTELHAELRALQSKIEEALQGAFLDSVLSLPPAERQAMVERMRHHRGALMFGPGPHPSTMAVPPPGAAPLPPGWGTPMPGAPLQPIEPPATPPDAPDASG